MTQETHPFTKMLTALKGTRLDPDRAALLSARSRASATAPRPASSATSAPTARAETGQTLSGVEASDAAREVSGLHPADAAGTVTVARRGGLGLATTVQASPAVTNRAIDMDAAGSVPIQRSAGGVSLGLGRVPAGAATQAAAAGPAYIKKSVAYSEEQQAIIQCPAKIVVADAFAGCGKTTTAIGFCEARPNQRIVYLVLNAANAAEAKARFPRNVSVMTTHSLAMNSPGMRRHIGERLDRRWNAMSLLQQFRIATPADAYNAKQVLQKFFGSTDKMISDKHVADLRNERNLSSSSAMNAVANASYIWKKICDPNEKCSIPDDAYLKLYALSAPQLPYDQIIMDEAQDANSVTAQIIAAQERARLLCIGDRHQSIYQFRGSVNAMEKFSIGAERFHITQTYRFGPRIAALANTILGDLKDEANKIKGMAADGVWNPKRVTHLSRTNAQLFSIAADRRGHGIYWVGKPSTDGYKVGRDGPDHYRLSLLADVYYLHARERSQIQDRALKQVGSFEEYKRYADDARDGEATIMCKLVDEHGMDTLQLIDDIRKNAAQKEAHADIVLTTAHKSKGLEWDCVQLCDDFEFLEDMEEDLANQADPEINTQDVNLLYVAITRAKQAISLNKETAGWLEKLPQHRENRRLNKERHARDRPH